MSGRRGPAPGGGKSSAARAAGGGVGALVVVLGDQLDLGSRLVREIDPARDVVLMMEVVEESRHVPSHKQRTVLFLSAMRHFAAELGGRGVRVRYVALDDPANTQSFTGEVRRAVEELRPERIRLIEPGEHRVCAMVAGWERELGVPVEVLEDGHFLTPHAEFARWATGRKRLVMEFFYREQRRRLGILVDGDGEPEGGVWNFDPENRVSFGKEGPKPRPPRAVRFAPDAITRGVMAVVEKVLPGNPGRLESFGWPVTRAQALEALADFVETRLAMFGPYEDAMWTGERVVYHSALSPALNLKLLDPRECVEAAVAAYRAGRAPLQSVEAFVRQVIGWREFIRGVYWFEGAGYGDRNSLGETGRLPGLYWDGQTEMNCLRECVGQVVEDGYGHHIQRLMVTGNFALLAGVRAREVADWYLGMYVDGVDWVTAPNVVGMVMHADARAGETAGVVGTKPYAASGRYVERMSNYCRGCRFDPGEKDGPRACPFTVLYWDFLARHRGVWARNQRMGMIMKNVERMSEGQLATLTVSARRVRRELGVAE